MVPVVQNVSFLKIFFISISKLDVSPSCSLSYVYIYTHRRLTVSVVYNLSVNTFSPASGFSSSFF